MLLRSGIISIGIISLICFVNPSFVIAADERIVGNFPWTAEAAQVAGRILAIRHVLGAGSAGSGAAVIDEGQHDTAHPGGVQAGIQPASAWAGGWSSLPGGSHIPIGLMATALSNQTESSSFPALPDYRGNDSLQTRVVLTSPMPRSTSLPLTVNSPRPFRLPEHYQSTLHFGAPLLRGINETGNLSRPLSLFARGVGVTNNVVEGITIITDLRNLSRSNDPAIAWRNVLNGIGLVTGSPVSMLADAGDTLRQRMIGRRNEWVIDKFAGPGAARIIFENNLDHPTRLSSRYRLGADSFSGYNDGFTRVESQMTIRQVRTETYGRFDYLHVGDPIRTSVVTSRSETIHMSQGWPKLGTPNLGGYQASVPSIDSHWYNTSIASPNFAAKFPTMIDPRWYNTSVANPTFAVKMPTMVSPNWNNSTMITPNFTTKVPTIPSNSTITNSRFNTR